MKLNEIAKIVNAQILIEAGRMSQEIKYAYCADLMSDVLRRTFDDAMLITGLANIHSVRTSEMLGINVMMYVRDKLPTKEVLEEALACGIAVLKCDMTMFEASGILYENGISPLGDM